MEKKNGCDWGKKLMEELKSDKKLLELGTEDNDPGSDSSPSEDELPSSIMNKILPRDKHKTNSGRKPKSRRMLNANTLIRKKQEVELKSSERIPKLFQERNETREVLSKPRITQRLECKNIIGNKSVQQIAMGMRKNIRSRFLSPKKEPIVMVPPAVMMVDAGTQTIINAPITLNENIRRNSCSKNKVKVPVNKSVVTIHSKGENNMEIIPEIVNWQKIDDRYTKLIKRPKITFERQERFPDSILVKNTPNINANAFIPPVSISCLYKKPKHIFRNINQCITVDEIPNKQIKKTTTNP